MNKICTSLKQSQKLIELGIDISTADMTWQVVGKNKLLRLCFNLEKYINHSKELIPAWSLSALLDILTEQDFTIKTISNKFNIDIPIRHCKLWFSSLLDAAVEMIYWLLKNKKL